MKKTAVIMQPTYLPWLGYFDLMDQADVFIFLDSVQFEKRSWQQRNRIKTRDGEHMLTISVKSKGKFHQKINDVKIDQTVNFVNDHLKAISYSYAKANYFKTYFPQLEAILLKKHIYLIDMNNDLVKWLRKTLGIKTKLIRSSDLAVSGTKAQLLLNICQELKCDNYLSAPGAKVYLGEGKMFTKQAIMFSYHEYVHPFYHQLHGRFIPYLSTIDLLFNEGMKSLPIIRSGRK